MKKQRQNRRGRIYQRTDEGILSLISILLLQFNISEESAYFVIFQNIGIPSFLFNIFQNICIPSFLFEEKIDGHYARHTKIHWFKTIAKSNSIFWKGKEPPSRFFSKNLCSYSSSTTGRPLWFCITYLPTRLAKHLGHWAKARGQNIPEIGFKTFSRKYSPKG